MKIRATCGCGKHKLKEFVLAFNADATIPNTPCGERWKLVVLVSADDVPDKKFPKKPDPLGGIFGGLF